MMGSQILANRTVLGDDNILSSSDIYHYMSAISNMFACGKWEVEDLDGVNDNYHPALKVLNNPNGYLTGFEFKRLLANIYLLYGQTFVVKDNNQLHVVKGLQPEITEDAVKVFHYDGYTLYQNEAIQIKNMGVSNNSGYGIFQLAKETLEGVLNAEKALTGKYVKGGYLAYLLKADTHLSPKNTLQNEMVERLQQKIQGMSDEDNTAIVTLSKGYTIEGFESPVQDDKVLEYLRVYKPELAKFLGFDPDAYNDLLKTDLERAATYLKSFVVDPFVNNVCEHLTRLILGNDSNKRIVLNIDIRKYLTMSQKISNTSNLIRTMCYTPDDGRSDLGLERLNTEESNKLYASKDLICLDDLSSLNKSKMEEGDKDE